ncbi:MAG: HesA/MoeB/ThiF family protein [Wujia sp.]
MQTDADLQINRYQRQLMLPEIGEQGQEKLKHARVLIVGAGGLGSPVAMYLTAAGVGHLGIMDADKVAVHNLQRQILHDESRVHMNKARSAQKTLQVMNHETTIQVYEEFLTSENAQLLASYDFVIDAVDNYKTKFLINDICVRMGKPFCHAGVSGFNGQAMTWIPNTECACYRCIFGEEPEDIEKPSDFGIIGPIPGILGSIQALEAIKYITGCGQLLTNRMFVFDGLSMKSRLVKLKKREGCKA